MPAELRGLVAKWEAFLNDDGVRRYGAYLAYPDLVESIKLTMSLVGNAEGVPPEVVNRADLEEAFDKWGLEEAMRRADGIAEKNKAIYVIVDPAIYAEMMTELAKHGVNPLQPKGRQAG